MELVAFILFIAVICVLLFGYPVAFTLAGVSLLFAFAGILTGNFDAALLQAFPSRLFGIMNNETLIAVPLFVFMGVMLQRSNIAEELLDAMASLFGSLRGGLGTHAGDLLRRGPALHHADRHGIHGRPGRRQPGRRPAGGPAGKAWQPAGFRGMRGCAGGDRTAQPLAVLPVPS